MPVHPLTVLFYGLALLAVILLLLLLWYRERGGTTFAQQGLGLLASLQFMAFLGAFSIGLYLAIAALAIGLALSASAQSHRRELGLMTLSASAMVGFWSPLVVYLRVGLMIGYALAVLFSLYQLIAGPRREAEADPGQWSIIVSGLLCMLSLLALPEGSSGLILLPGLALTASLITALAAPHWRVQGAVIAAASALMFWGLILA